jgi:hypothetical protein
MFDIKAKRPGHSTASGIEQFPFHAELAQQRRISLQTPNNAFGWQCPCTITRLAGLFTSRTFACNVTAQVPSVPTNARATRDRSR